MINIINAKMKKNKKIIIALIIIILIVAIFVKIGNMVFESIDSLEALVDESMGIYESNDSDSDGGIIGKGSIVSFNIEELNIGYWSNIDEVYVNNEDMVESNQKILKVSNDEATGIIYSTIKGKFFIDDTSETKRYLIYDLDNVGIEIEVSEKDSSKIKIGQKVNVTLNSSSNNLEGRVYYISKISNDGVIKVKIKIDYSDKIKFGYTAKAEILVDEDVDSSVQEFDTKNSFIKIGKTAITYKNVDTETVIDQTPEIDMDYILSLLPEDFDLSAYLGEELGTDEQSPDEIEFDVEDISEYYNGYWNEYWNEYWSTYYQTGETIPDVTD